MDKRRINIFLTPFEGLGQPHTLSLQASRKSTILDMNNVLLKRMSNIASDAPYFLPLPPSEKLEPSSTLPLASLLEQESIPPPIRPSTTLVGGKKSPEGVCILHAVIGIASQVATKSTVIQIIRARLQECRG
jgi:hypothetical protein